jgi:predicted glycosyltransferase
MKIWYDACTGKHIRYGTAIAQRMRKRGHEVVFTTREHPDTVRLAQHLGEDPIVVGKYCPQSLFSRLEESAERVLQFSKMFKDDTPDVAISHQSVELCRTAFGLGIPIILTADTPHATAVNRLTIPFASTLVVSSAIPKRFLRNHCAKNIIQFDGVDEVAWIKGFKPSSPAGLEKPLIVVREMEHKAAYASGGSDLTVNIAEKLGKLGNVHFIRRYNQNGKKFGAKEGFVDSASLVAHADLVVSAGGTLAREAALQGVPSIVFSDLGRTYVNLYLAEQGFPLFFAKPRRLVGAAKKYMGKRFDAEAKLALLENPVDKIEEVVTEAESAALH